MTATITIHGIDKLVAKLGRLESVQLLRLPMHAATKLIYAEAIKYPGQTKKPFKFVSDKQRRYVIMAIRKGIIQVPYRRRKSSGLAGSWVERVEDHGDSLVGIVGSSISYGPFVMSPDNQAQYHQGNWQTTDDIVNTVANPISKLFQKTIDKALAGP